MDLSQEDVLYFRKQCIGKHGEWCENNGYLMGEKQEDNLM
jgi:hypothetical protein